MTLGVGLAIACAVMVAVHLWRPFIMSRYLVALHPPIAMMLALGAAALLDRVRPLFVTILSVLMSLAGLAAIHANMVRTVAQPSWYGTGRAIATIRRNCPTTRIHVDASGNRLVMATPPSENRDVFPLPIESSRIISAFRSPTRTTGPCRATAPRCSGPSMSPGNRTPPAIWRCGCAPRAFPSAGPGSSGSAMDVCC